MPSPFDTLDYATTAALVTRPDDFAEAEAMVYRDRPDYWTCGGAEGDGFLGPKGLDTRGLSEQQVRAVSTLDRDVRSSLKRSFAPLDRLGEVSGRRIDGVLAADVRVVWEVERTLAPETKDETTGAVTPAEQPDAAEAERIAELAAVTEWAFSTRGRIQSRLRQGLRAVNAFGSGFVRPYVPAGRVGVDGKIVGPRRRAAGDVDLGRALSALRLEVVTPDRATVYTDTDTEAEVSVVTFARREASAASAGSPASVDMSYVDEDVPPVADQPVTVLSVRDEGAAPREVLLPLRGRLLLAPMRSETGPFITAEMRTLAKRVNTASTELAIVNDEDSFRVRMLLGARPPGNWVTTEAEGQKTVEFVPEPWNIGPRAILNVGGEEAYATDNQGGAVLGPDGTPVVTGTSRPTVATFEAADDERFSREVAQRTLEIREAARQGWVSQTGEAGVSGVSREVSMTDYRTDGEAVANMVSACAEEVLTLVADYAAYLSGTPGRFYGIRPRVECRVSRPTLTPEERRASIELRNADVWSLARTRQFNGVEDTVSEAEEVAREREAEAGRDVTAFFGATRPTPGGDGQAGITPDMIETAAPAGGTAGGDA